MTDWKVETRAGHIRRMFERIAPHYDWINTLMSGGRDQVWRRAAVREANVAPGDWVLDVATGTGNMALEAARQHGVRVVAIDFTLEMMQQARNKPGQSAIGWAGGNALRLPFPDNTFKAVLSGFMMRNVLDIPAAFAEQYRVARPGGRVVCLEISPTPVPAFKLLFRLYFHHLAPRVGGLLSRQPDAYTYLPNSVASFLTADELAAVMRSVGLEQVRYRRLMLGTVTIHVGVKPEA